MLQTKSSKFFPNECFFGDSEADIFTELVLPVDNHNRSQKSNPHQSFIAQSRKLQEISFILLLKERGKILQ